MSNEIDVRMFNTFGKDCIGNVNHDTDVMLAISDTKSRIHDVFMSNEMALSLAIEILKNH